jgi:LysM repeat protein
MPHYRGRHLKARPKRRGPVVVATAASMSLSSTAHAASHVVRSGETLSGIAARHGTSVSALARLNRLADPDLIVAGQRLRLGGGGGSRRTYTVVAGDTLSGIASRFGTTIAAVARANGVKNPNLIVVGSRLQIPSGGGGGGGPVTSSVAPATSIAASLDNQARAHGVDPALVKAVAWQESGWQQDVRSSAGAIGVMQVMPATARWVNRYLGGHDLDVRVADDNVHLGVMYLRHLLDNMGSVRRALAGYYSGPGAVGKKLNLLQRSYVNNVLALQEQY